MVNEDTEGAVGLPARLEILPALREQGADFSLERGAFQFISSPAWVYLQTLSKGDSERTGRSALRSILQVIFLNVELSEDTIFRFHWEELRYEHTVVIRRELADKYDFVTANKILSVLRQVLKQAWLMGLMQDGVYLRSISIKSVKGQKDKAGRLVTAEEFGRMVETCLSDLRPQGYRDLALLVVLYVTGIRRRELSALNFEDYDPASHALKILGKNNKKRTVYINAEGAAAALDLWLAVRGRENGPLFTPIEVNGHVGRVGKKVRRKNHVDTRPLARLSPEGIYKVFMTRAEEARVVDEKGKVNVRPHDLRRTLISLYFESGVDVAIMKRLTGHVKTDTLVGYDRRGDEAVEKAAQVIVLPNVLTKSAAQEKSRDGDAHESSRIYRSGLTYQNGPIDDSV